jgi:outer membrane protein TolC
VSRWRRYTVELAAGLAVLAAAPGAAVAEAAPEPGAVSLPRAIELGARRAPPVAEASRSLGAASEFARRPGSALPAAPQASVLAGARAPRGLPVGPEVSLTVQQEVSLRALGRARRVAAEWTERAAAGEVDRARLEGAVTAALAWVDLLEAQELLRVRGSAADAATRLAGIADVRARSGVATAVERSLAESEVGAARLAILEAEGRAAEARLDLATSAGLSPSALLTAEGALGAPDEMSAPPDAIATHPAVRAADARAMQLAAEASAVRAAAGPNVSVGATMWREGSGDHAAALLLTVPLPFVDPGRHDVARQEVIAAAAAGHSERVRMELEREVRLAAHERAHAREVLAQVRDHVLAPTRRALDAALSAYTLGTSDLGVVLLARRSALGAEERLVMAFADVRRADLRFAALTGALLAGVRR